MNDAYASNDDAGGAMDSVAAATAAAAPHAEVPMCCLFDLLDHAAGRLLSTWAPSASNGSEGSSSEGGSSSSNSSSNSSQVRQLLQLLQLSSLLPRARLAHSHLLNQLVTLTAAAAPSCTINDLVQLMSQWAQLGFSSVWRRGGLRRGYRRLSGDGALAALSNAELTAAVAAAGKLPPLQKVVVALATEVDLRLVQQRQQQQQHQVWHHSPNDKQALPIWDDEQQLTSTGSAAAPQQQQQQQQQRFRGPFTPDELVSITAALPSLAVHWPAELALNLMVRVEGLIDQLSPADMWRVWSALQHLQQHWQPSVAAAAAVAAVPSESLTVLQLPELTAASAGDDDDNPAFLQQQQQQHQDNPFPQQQPLLPVSQAGAAAAQDQSAPGFHHVLHLQHVLQHLLQRLGGALAHVAPVHLPLEAAPVKAANSGGVSDTYDRAGRGAPAALPGAGPKEQQQQQQQGPILRKQLNSSRQLLQHFAKARRALLNPRMSPQNLAHTCEGLAKLLAVARFRRAADKAPAATAAVLRALQAAAWPDLCSNSLDGQQLLLLLRAAKSLGATDNCQYVTFAVKVTADKLLSLPGDELASVLGRTAAAHIPRFGVGLEMLLLRLWVGRVQQLSLLKPEHAVTCIVALVELGFKPAPGAAALVVQPLLRSAAAGAAAGAAAAAASSSSSSRCKEQEQQQQGQCLSGKGLLLLVRALADLNLRPSCLSHQHLLLTTLAAVTPSYNVSQLLLLGQCLVRLALLELPAAAPPPPAAAPPPPVAAAVMVADGGSSSSSSNKVGVSKPAAVVPAAAAGSSSTLAAAAAAEPLVNQSATAAAAAAAADAMGRLLQVWLEQLLLRGTRQMSSSQVS
jgi:hypothetical protein